MNPHKIIYLIGTGHSGSTLLDIILGALPHGVAVGELVGFYQWLQNKLKTDCSCGQNITNCEFWSDVFDYLENRVGEGGITKYSNLQLIYERSHLISLFPRMFFQNQFWGDSKATKYFQLSAELNKSILEISGATYIVDSSKSLVRLWSLFKNPYVDLFLVHIIRDPRAVANSYYKHNLGTKGTEIWGSKTIYLLRMVIMWILYNLLCEILPTRMEKGRYIQITYEDLIKEPNNILEKIGRIVDENYSSVAHKLMSEEIIKIGHVVGGNQKLRENQFRMVMDNKWKNELSKVHQWMIWLITGVFARRYGLTKIQ